MRRLAGFVSVLAVGIAASSAPLAANPLQIGVEAPLSGPTAIFGEQIRLGVQQAVSDADAAGGFSGQSAEVVARDDAGDPKRGAEVANAFVVAKTPFVVGPFSSSVAVAASSVYAEAGVVDISPSAAAPLLTERGLTNVFRTCSREDAQAAVAARYLLARRITRIAIVHDRTTSGKALADAVRALLAAANRKDIFYGSIDKGAPDVSALAGRLKASGAQLVFWGGGGAGAAQIMRQLRDINAKITLMGGIAMASEDFAGSAGATIDGALMVFPQDPRTRPAAADLLRRLQAAGKDPGAYVFYAYAAVQVLEQAADAALSVDPKTVAATMHSGMIFKTVLGDFTFDGKGDPVPADLVVYVWHKGASGRMTFDEQAKT